MFFQIDDILAGWSLKCKLTEKILSCYDDFRKVEESNSTETPEIPLTTTNANGVTVTKGQRLKAKCTLCDKNAPYKFFVKGNNSNLKTHLMKVDVHLHLYFVRAYTMCIDMDCG